MVYNSVDNSHIKDIAKLKTKKYRDRCNLFLVEGEHLVHEAYKSGSLEELLVLDNTVFSLDVKTNYVSSNVMKYLSELDTFTNVIGVCKSKQGSISGKHILVLDNIQDPGNLGTIIRSCVAFNIDTLILINCVDQYNSKVLRACQGLNFHLNIMISDYDILDKLKELGYHIYGTKVTLGNSLKTVAKSPKFAIIMGNEGNGISKYSEEISDDFLYIETSNLCESLNVGVAASIILYEISR